MVFVLIKTSVLDDFTICSIKHLPKDVNTEMTNYSKILIVKEYVSIKTRCAASVLRRTVF